MFSCLTLHPVWSYSAVFGQSLTRNVPVCGFHSSFMLQLVPLYRTLSWRGARFIDVSEAPFFIHGSQAKCNMIVKEVHWMGYGCYLNIEYVFVENELNATWL